MEESLTSSDSRVGSCLSRTLAMLIASLVAGDRSGRSQINGTVLGTILLPAYLSPGYTLFRVLSLHPRTCLKGKLQRGKGQRRKVSHEIHTGPVIYLWVPEGSVHPNVHMVDRDFSLTRRKTFEHTIRSCSARTWTHQANGHDIHIEVTAHTEKCL